MSLRGHFIPLSSRHKETPTQVREKETRGEGLADQPQVISKGKECRSRLAMNYQGAMSNNSMSYNQNKIPAYTGLSH